jgi:hypothetical protein
VSAKIAADLACPMCLHPGVAWVRASRRGDPYMFCEACVGRIFLGRRASANHANIATLAGRYWRGEADPGLPACSPVQPGALRCPVCWGAGAFLRFDRRGSPNLRAACCASRVFVHDELGLASLTWLNPEIRDFLRSASTFRTGHAAPAVERRPTTAATEASR